MKKFFVFLFMLFVTTNLGFSADWYGNDRFGFLIDKSSIVKTKDSVRAWVIMVGAGKIKNKKYAYVESYIDAKCSDNTLASFEHIYYTKKHKSIESYNFELNNAIQYNRIVPDTKGEAIFNDLCSMR